MSELEALTGGVEAPVGGSFEASNIPAFAWFEFGAFDQSDRAEPIVKCLIGDGTDRFIETKGGFGRWEIVTRPYLPALVIWRGPTEAYSHRIPFMLDGWTDGHSDVVEKGVRNIERLAGMWTKPGKNHTLPEPFKLFLNGFGAIPNDYTVRPSTEWVITDIEWGEPTRGSNGHLLRQTGAITFTVYHGDTELERADQHPPIKHPYAVTKRRTFHNIAGKALRHPQMGTKLAILNGRQNGMEMVSGTIELPDQAMRNRWKHELGIH